MDQETINIAGMSDKRLMCLFMEICARLYYYGALLEEEQQVDEEEALRWMQNYQVTRKEVIKRGLLDEAFNLN